MNDRIIRVGGRVHDLRCAHNADDHEGPCVPASPPATGNFSKSEKGWRCNACHEEIVSPAAPQFHKCPSPSATAETFWCIERSQPEGSSVTYWWMGENSKECSPTKPWTTDIGKAKQYDTKAEAEEVIEAHSCPIGCHPLGHATGHMWVPASPRTSGTPQCLHPTEDNHPLRFCVLPFGHYGPHDWPAHGVPASPPATGKCLECNGSEVHKGWCSRNRVPASPREERCPQCGEEGPVCKHRAPRLPEPDTSALEAKVAELKAAIARQSPRERTHEADCAIAEVGARHGCTCSPRAETVGVIGNRDPHATVKALVAAPVAGGTPKEVAHQSVSLDEARKRLEEAVASVRAAEEAYERAKRITQKDLRFEVDV